MGRAPCCDKNGLKKGPWTPEEDQKLIDYIRKHGYGNWRTLPSNAGLQRCGKSCRLRWTNYLRPDIKRGRFSFQEEETIIQLHTILGNKWSAIAARLPGRTDNEIKNYWNTHIRKRLLRMGIDPVTHSPRLDLLDLSSILSSSLYNNNNNHLHPNDSHHHQINLSRLLGIQQPLVNPELLKLATSPQHNRQSHLSYLLPQNNLQENQFLNQHVHNQMTPLVQDMNTNTSCVPYSGDAQLMQPDNVEQLSSNYAIFGNQDFAVNEWASLADDGCYLPAQDCAYQQGSSRDHKFIMEPRQSETTTTTTFQSNNSTNLSYQSVLSTPSSSPAPPNSHNSANKVSGSCTTEDERDSYCSSILKFEIPHILDVNEFM